MLVGAAGLGGCFFVDALSDPAEPVPELPVVFGLRADGAGLLIATGWACPAETVLSVTFSRPDERAAYLEVAALATVDLITVPTAGDSFTVERALPDGFDWAEYQTVNVSAALPQATAWGAVAVDLDGLAENTAAHPAGEYYFGEAGWMTPQAAAERDGQDLFTVCTPWDE
jgi:hypothetical protein